MSPYTFTITNGLENQGIIRSWFNNRMEKLSKKDIEHGKIKGIRFDEGKEENYAGGNLKVHIDYTINSDSKNFQIRQEISMFFRNELHETGG